VSDTQKRDEGDGHILSIAKIIPKSRLAQLVLAVNAQRSMKQAARMPGLLEAVAPAPSGGAAFVVSLWQNEAALRTYVHSGIHGKAAVGVRKLARAHVSCHVPWANDAIPDWSEWGAILASNPHIIDARHVGNLTREQKLAGPSRMGTFPPPLRAKGPMVD
jgi:hypothetical protein